MSMMSLCAATSSRVFGLYFSTHGCESRAPSGPRPDADAAVPAADGTAMTPRSGLRAPGTAWWQSLAVTNSIKLAHQCILLMRSIRFKIHAQQSYFTWSQFVGTDCNI